MKVAVTGNIGSGKTFFSHMLSRKHIPVIDADSEGKRLLMNNREEVFQMLNLKMSGDYVNTLKCAILNDSKLFELYNNWVYKKLPHIIIDKIMNDENVIADCALIFEWDIAYIFDKVILIDGGNREQRMERKGGMDKELVKLLESHQYTVEEKRIRADIIIENRGSKEELSEKATELYCQLFVNNGCNAGK